MKRLLLRLFLWSWIITLPVVVVGGVWLYNTVERFYTYKVRYEPGPDSADLDLASIGRYEIDRLLQKLRAYSSNYRPGANSGLRIIHLFITEPNIAQLESHMPQSGFEYVKGRIVLDGALKKIKVKYRGDTHYRRAWDKKSIRIKTSNSYLVDDLRSINLISPRTAEQLNNFLSYRLAKNMGLLAPKTDLVRLYINGEDRGVHILVEQVKELTLRNSGWMPGDIYRGEIIGKDQFRQSGINNLFDSSSVWDKVAVNNHYADDFNLPLETLLKLVNRSEKYQSQSQLANLMDMEAWGRFSAYESLTQSKHADISHNWRLYYDPWRGKFMPIVWDTMGWYEPMRGAQILPEIITNRLTEALFKNGNFIRSRSRALKEFFDSGSDILFMRMVSESIKTMESEVLSDPLLYPANSSFVQHRMRQLQKVIGNVLEYNKLLLRKSHVSDDSVASYRYADNVLELSVRGKHPLETLKLEFFENLGSDLQIQAEFKDTFSEHLVDLTEFADIYENFLELNPGFLSILTLKRIGNGLSILDSSPGDYRVYFSGLGKNLKLKSVALQRADSWIPVEPVDVLKLGSFSSLHAPVSYPEVESETIWSGDILLDGYQTLNSHLTIKSGTTVRFSPGATLVLKGQLTAIGTPERPIRFLPLAANHDPWGSVVLMGHGADGSTLTNCEMAGGSGLKGDLFEYSAMFSIHDVDDVSISDCVFRDNQIVDDMVHAVYAKIYLDRVTFKNAVSDALDLDICEAEIKNSQFDSSLNDGVDLMSTRATIIGSVFRNNGDKGISVGENSHLVGINNILERNAIGIQSKDRSTAVLFNHALIENKIALSAYKKNWRYGDGGEIFIGKSRIVGDGIIDVVDKHSFIQLFDSYLSISGLEKTSQLDIVAVDSRTEFVASESRMFPKSDIGGTNLDNAIQTISQELLDQVKSSIRGVTSDGQ